MRVLHCCLAAFYVDGYGYQENILTKMHKVIGCDVGILASTETYVDKKKIGYVEPGRYINEHGIPVERVPYVPWIPHFLAKKLRLYRGVYAHVEAFSPDVIFLHDVQFLSVSEIRKYVRGHPHVRVFVDGHTDFHNSARSWISKNILHGIIYRFCAKRIEPFVEKFWGVTPLRADFFVDVYKISPSKVDVLVMGVDDSVVDFSSRGTVRKKIRLELGIADDDFVLVTGGKIDRRKKIDALLSAYICPGFKKTKLLIFGVPSADMKKSYEDFVNAEGVIALGWLPPDKIYDYLFASDLAVFPGTHSVLWEQVVGVGLPAIFRRWKGMEHVSLGGNCLFLEEGSQLEITQVILRVMNDRRLYEEMLRKACENGPRVFSYSTIARKSIGIEG